MVDCSAKNSLVRSSSYINSDGKVDGKAAETRSLAPALCTAAAVDTPWGCPRHSFAERGSKFCGSVTKSHDAGDASFGQA